MLGWLIAVGVTAVLAFVVYVLFFDTKEATGTSLDDFIAEGGDEAVVSRDASDRYRTCYEEPGKQVLILYGTEYGFSEEIARKLFDNISDSEKHVELEVQPRVVNAHDYELLNWEHEQVLLCVFSTSGDGVPPTDARSFMNWIASTSAPSLAHVSYSVLALGDSNYPHFCRTGRALDKRLTELGGSCIQSSVDVDQEDWSAIDGWIATVSSSLLGLSLKTAVDYLDLTAQEGEGEGGFSRTRPFLSTMTVKYPLTAMDTDSDKETIHTEFDLTGSDLQFTSGDALGIYPLNNPPEVDQLLSAMHSPPDATVPVPAFCYHPKPDGSTITLRNALMKYYDLKTVRMELARVIMENVTSESEKERANQLLQDGLNKTNRVLIEYLSEREVVDIVRDFPSSSLSPAQLLGQLKPLQPRYYSIASSPKKDPNLAAVCAAVVRYSLLGQPRTGVCTTFLQDRFSMGEQAPVFISHNPDFRLPTDPSVPIIMIGPGTGIAPFRAFIQERELSKPCGENVFYFGCRHKHVDFLYREELERWSENGLLTLRTAFSRDQPHKIYVQDIIREDGAMIWRLLQSGAHVYICGDAKHMAGDVHQSLLVVLQEHGNMDNENATQFMQELEEKERYQKDVWVT